MNKQIAIVGAGVSGLSCAWLLSKNGYDINIFAKAFSPDITSNRAAAFWFPYHIRNDKRGIDWCSVSYDYYKQFSEDTTTGISIKKLIKVLRKGVEDEEPVWIDFMPENTCRLMDASELDNDIGLGYEIKVPLIETQIFLPWLSNELIKKGVLFYQKEIESLHELTSNYAAVINCTGLGAQKICNDRNIIPVRGQVALLEPLEDFDIYLDNEMPLYIVPRKDAMIIGGTYEENVYIKETEPDTIKKLLENAYSVFPELKRNRVIGDWAGLRPFRNEVRVEQEIATNIIHNYGHGGSGFTLAFGCAKEVCTLTENIINQK